MSVKEIIFNQTVFMPLPSQIILNTNVGIDPYVASWGGYFEAKKGNSFNCYGVYHELNGGFHQKGYYYLILHGGDLCVVPFDVASPKWGGKHPLAHIWQALRAFTARKAVSAL